MDNEVPQAPASSIQSTKEQPQVLRAGRVVKSTLYQLRDCIHPWKPIQSGFAGQESLQAIENLSDPANNVVVITQDH